MFQPEQFIDFANKIFRDKNQKTQAATRTALSRPYIAILSKSKSKLEQKGKTFPINKELHKEIVEELKNYDNKLADKLDDLHSYRFDADFNLSYTPDPELIPETTAIAKSFFRIAKKKLS